MWTYAQSVAAYHAAPQRILDFWDVCYQVHMRFSYWACNIILQDIRIRSRLALFHLNCQLNHNNGWPVYYIELLPGDPELSMMPDAPWNGTWFTPTRLTSYWVASIHTWWDYPLPPRRVRKSYWTGTPRRRRNI